MIRMEDASVADIVWKAHSPLQSRLVPGRFGASLAQPGIRLTDIRAFSLVQIMARRGQWDATTRAAKTCFGIEAPDRPKAVVGRKALLLWSGPDQFLALASQAGEAGSFETLRQAFAGAARPRVHPHHGQPSARRARETFVA
jgi:sarcosine oxidase subunit gamma